MFSSTPLLISSIYLWLSTTNSSTVYLRHAAGSAHFAQAFETDVRGAKAAGKNVVINGGNLKPRNETRTCYNCNGNKNKCGGKGNERGVQMTPAAVNDKEIVKDRRILDSGFS